MQVIINIPGRIVEKAKKLGIDLETLALETIIRELNLDPDEEAEIRLGLAEKSLEEAKNHIRNRDPIQASEKLYKAIEECIKILSQIYKLPQYEKARAEGRWWIQLIGKAARRLSKTLREPRIEEAWAIAYDIHVWGFHEAKYDIGDIEDDIKYAEWIINYTKKKVKVKE
ncbi:superfamily I DNA and RNA helicase and helicaseubunit [Candidatus Geothermarchaeota archaeon]|nr:MAG: superfamily I DNA and RNA helicase and helicaseubunit [Candidatus Geothermarchaeota archaeon]HEW93747.1 superfamily I DNA and RNA helicase and helicaseubunit [Thermoprotei archaeon]